MSRFPVCRGAAERAVCAISNYYRPTTFVLRSNAGVRYRFEETCSACPQAWTVYVGDTRARLHVSMRGHGFHVWYWPHGFSEETGEPYPGQFHRVLQDDLRLFGVATSEFTSIAQRNEHLRRAINAIDMWRFNTRAGIPNVEIPPPPTIAELVRRYEDRQAQAAAVEIAI
jgi:hypothetical protein